MIGTSVPGWPGTMPPPWNFGMFGTLMELPPMPGTHPGIDQDSRPIVLFQASAMKLKAHRNGRVM